MKQTVFRSNPLLIPFLLGAVLLCACSQQPVDAAKGAATKRPSSTPVRVTRATRQDVALEIRAIGNVEAYSSVAVKSRVAGQMQKVHLRDGQDVRKGDLLFEIDPLPFIEQFKQAEANLARNIALEKQAQANVARDQAAVKTARTQADRYASLMKEGITSREQNEQFRSAAEAAEASLAANSAAIESARAAIQTERSRVEDARLQLGYTKIAAPISGRAGAVAVKEGNLVKENDTISLVTILQVTPISVSFAVPEQSLSDVRRFMRERKLTVEAVPDGSGDAPATGTLDFIDNTVDSTTGTIRMKATFANAGLRLWPGQFVNTTLRLSTERDRIVVPSQAVQNAQSGKYVWVVKPDLTTEMRMIEVVRTRGDLTVVAGGLNGDENLVTEGQMRVTSGTKVQVLKPAAAAAPPSDAKEVAR